MNAKNDRRNGILKSTLAPALAGAALVLIQAPGASAQRIIDLGAPAAPAPPAAPGVTSGSESFHGSYTVVNNGDTVKVESDGQKAKVTLNGEVITTLDMTGDWTRYEVQNAKGEVVATVLRPSKGSPLMTIFSGKAPPDALSRGGNAWFSGPGTGTWTFNLGDLDELRALGRGTGAYSVFGRPNPPKVMIGVYLGNMDTDAAAKAGLDPDKVTEVSGVVPDGPADLAGLQAGDVITGIDGLANGDLATIQDTLKKKNPGDTLNLTILRDGQKKQVSLTLKAYDAGAFGIGAAPDDVQVAELGAKMAELSAQLAKASGAQADAIRKQLQEASKQLTELNAQAHKRAIAGLGKSIVVVPQPPSPPNAKNESLQMQFNDLQSRLDDKLAEIDKRLDEMDQRIDRKLNELVDQLVKRMNERTKNPQ